MITISFLNNKGGTGKTTLCVNVASELVKRGKRVLVVDMDQQCNSTDNIANVGYDTKPSIYDVMNGNAEITDTIIHGNKLDLEGKIKPDLVPSNLIMATADITFTGSLSSFLLADAINVDDVVSNYDFCLIDCPPSLGVAAISSLVASEWCLVPVEASRYANSGLNILYQSISEVKKLKQRMNQDIEILGIVLNKYNERYNVSQFNRALIEDSAKMMNTRLFDAVVHRSVQIEEASTNQMSVVEWSKNSRSADDIKLVVDEMLRYIEG